MEEYKHLLPTVIYSVDNTRFHPQTENLQIHGHAYTPNPWYLNGNQDGSPLCHSIHGQERMHHDPNFPSPNLLLETFSSFSWVPTPNSTPWWHSSIKSAPLSITQSPTQSKLSLSWTCKSVFLKPENVRPNSIENQPIVWHYFTSTLTIHSVVKKVSSALNHFDTTRSSQRTTSCRKNSTISHTFYLPAHTH